MDQASNVGILLLIIAGLGALIVKVLVPSIASLAAARGRPKTDPPPAGGSPHSGRGNGSAASHSALNDWAACKAELSGMSAHLGLFHEEQRRCNDALTLFLREEMLPVLRKTSEYLGQLRHADDQEALAEKVAASLRRTGEGMPAVEDGARRRVTTPR